MTGEKKEEKKTCNYQSPYIYAERCGRPLYDGRHCLFHSEEIEGKKEKFNDQFWDEFDRQKTHEENYDFDGFVFPSDISFEGKTFEKNASFWDVQFYGEAIFRNVKFSWADFRYAKFSEEANFRDAQFSKEALFGNTQFSKNNYFIEVRFSKKADFEKAQFPGGNFWGAQFPEEANFNEAQFYGPITFGNAQFTGSAYFHNNKFSGYVDFGWAQFSKDAYFGWAQFSGEADFKYAQFSGKAGFWNAQFSGEADFSNAQFSEKADFTKAIFSRKAGFSDAEFHSKSNFTDVKFEDFNQCNMINTSFYNVFSLLEHIAESRNRFKHPKGIKYLHDKLKPILGEPTVFRLPLLSREVRDDLYLMSFKEKNPKLFFIWWLFADCGRNFTRWMLWSILFVVLFAFIYHNIFYLSDVDSFYRANIHDTWSGFSLIYYSVVTFTTLGFGDIHPKPGWLQFWVALEVILGYIMLGGLISILANKLARRS